MGVRYARFEDMKTASGIRVDGWKAAYKGILADEFLNTLDYEATHKRFENNFNKEAFGVYESDTKEILGFCKFGERQNLELEGYHEYDCELGAIYVRSDCQGQGIGKELFIFVTSEFRRKGKSKMLLWVLAENIPSIAFYKKMGGKLVSKKVQAIGGDTYYEVSFGYDL